MPPLEKTKVLEVSAGENVILPCTSNDGYNNFLHWFLNNNQFVGVFNDFYDKRKYKYKVLSGNLTINDVTPADAGFYRCVSRSVTDNDVSIGTVQLVVDGVTSPLTHSDIKSAELGEASDVFINTFQIIAIVISFAVLIGCGVMYFKLKKDWDKYDGRTVVPVDEEDDEDGDIIYNKTTTAIDKSTPGPSRNASSDLLFGVDNAGLDTDFNSVFENIRIKTPNRELI